MARDKMKFLQQKLKDSYGLFDHFVNITVWYKSVQKFKSSEWEVNKM